MFRTSRADLRRLDSVSNLELGCGGQIHPLDADVCRGNARLMTEVGIKAFRALEGLIRTP